MKSKIWSIFLSVCIIALLVSACSSSGNKPFKDLKSEEIASASVLIVLPGKTVNIDDVEQLTKYLNDIEIYERDDSYVDYYGQSITFYIKKTDGSELKVFDNNSFIVIDDIGYRCEYAPAEALSNYANSLIK